MLTLIRNGRVALDGSIQALDIQVAEGRIQALSPSGGATPTGGTSPSKPGLRVIDAAGCYVLPGFIDFHTHVDDQIGPFQLADSYASATRLALENGITSLCAFVTQGPGESLPQAMTRARVKAEGHSHCDVAWHLTPTRFDPADLATLGTLLGNGYRTLKLYTTYKDAGIFSSYELIEQLFASLGPLGARFLVHCEDDGVIAAVDPSGLDLGQALSHTLLRPEAAELVAIQRVVALALAHRAALHVVHVSTLAGARHLLDRRPQGELSFETCPQYLFLDPSWLARADGHRWLCSPPLRGEREPFREMVRQGGADILATDHCPFCARDKDGWSGQDLRAVPNGLPGLGALPHLAWRLWREDPDRAALALARHLSQNPAERAGLAGKGALRPGLDADIVILDPAGPERPLRSSRSDAPEAYPGFSSPLVLRQVLLRGEPRVAEGRLLQPDAPQGRCLQPDPASLALI